MKSQIENLIQFFRGKMLLNIRIFHQEILEIPAGLPCLHGIALDDHVGILPRQSLFRHRQHDLL